MTIVLNLASQPQIYSSLPSRGWRIALVLAFSVSYGLRCFPPFFVGTHVYNTLGLRAAADGLGSWRERVEEAAEEMEAEALESSGVRKHCFFKLFHKVVPI